MVHSAAKIVDLAEIKLVAKGKTQRKFSFFVGGDRNKEYLWRAESEEERSHWLGELKKHYEYYAQLR